MAKIPGKDHRKGITLVQFLRAYPANEAAEQWFGKQRSPDGVCCPFCGSLHMQELSGRQDMLELDTTSQTVSMWPGIKEKRMTYRSLIADNGLTSRARA